MRIVGVLVAMLVAGTAVAGESSADGLVVFSSDARVEVDAAGNVIDVREDPALPAEIGQALGAKVRGWKFDPPVRDGVTVGGVTYVRLGACAAPAEGGAYRLAFQYNGNGPLKRDFVPLRYPKEALTTGVEGNFEVTYRVEPDGTAIVEAIKGPRRELKYFKATLETWIETAAYEPELVGGQAVATRLSVPVEFNLVDRGERAPQQDHRERSSCQAALGKAADQDRTVALDSPFKRLATN